MSNLYSLLDDARKHPEKTGEVVREAVKAKQLTYRDLDYSALFFESHGGYARVRSWLTNEGSSYRQLKESVGGSTAAFQAITTPFIEQALVTAYEIPEAVFSAKIPSIKTVRRNEVRRGITNIGDEAMRVDEGKDYPEVAVAADWIRTPDIIKKGFVLSLTKEAILLDETGQLIEQASRASEWFRLHWEKLAIRCVVDQGETADARYRYNWQGVAYATYADDAGGRGFDNLVASNPLTDGTAIDTAVLALMAINDPATGEPANLMARQLIVPPGLYRRAAVAVGGEFAQATGGYPTSGNPAVTSIPNPTTQIWGDMEIVKGNQLLANALGNQTTWFIGDMSKAFAFMEAIPFSAVQEGEDGPMGFQRDVVQRFKVSRMGTYATLNPRHMVRCNA